MYSNSKDLPPTDFKTHRKNEYPLPSPIRLNLNQSIEQGLSRNMFRSPLKEKDTIEYNRVKT